MPSERKITPHKKKRKKNGAEVKILEKGIAQEKQFTYFCMSSPVVCTFSDTVSHIFTVSNDQCECSRRVYTQFFFLSSIVVY